MQGLLHFLKTDTWVWVSNILLLYAIVQIFINKWVIRKHNKKMEHYPHLVSGGTSESWDKNQQAIKYSKSKLYKFVEFLKKIF